MIAPNRGISNRGSGESPKITTIIFDMARVTEAMIIQLTNTPSKIALKILKKSVALLLSYRCEISSISVRAFDLRHKLAKKNTEIITPITLTHQIQFA